METTSSFASYFKDCKVPVSVTLPPHCIDRHLRHHLYEVIQQRYEHQCYASMGYIVHVNGIDTIVSMEIGSINPHVYVSAYVSMRTFVPTVSMILTVPIEMIFIHGVYLIWEKIRILIPVQHVHPYRIQRDFSGYILMLPPSECPSSPPLRKGDTMKIHLLDIRFEKDGYSCIADIVRSTDT